METANSLSPNKSSASPHFQIRVENTFSFWKVVFLFRMLDNEKSSGTKQPFIFNMYCTSLLCRFLDKCPCLSHCAYLGIVDSWKWDNQIQNHVLITVVSYDKKVKCSCYRPGVAQTVSRGIALLFHDRGTRRGQVVSSAPWLHLTPGKDPAPIFQEAGWVPGPVWTGGKSRPHRDSMPDRPARSQSL